MFNVGSQSTIIKAVVESSISELESTNSSADSYADLAKVGVWVWAFKPHTHKAIHYHADCIFDRSSVGMRN